MKITFKNVGQGDSILIQWEDEGKAKIGIIDCNTIGEESPLVEHLKLIPDLEEIEFIFLSHPHADHYSGMEALLHFCETEKIQINNFLHTCQSVPEYLKIAALTRYEDQTLGSLFTFAQKLYKTGRIVSFGHVNAGFAGVFHLSSRWALKILSPDHDELSAFNKLVHVKGNVEPYRSNLLSTILKIYDKDCYALLTSDADEKAFGRILRRSSGEFGRSRLKLGQASHHGAKGNYHQKFWKNQIHDAACPIAISVGLNGYGHPSVEVITSLASLGYHIETTDGTVGPPSSTEILLDSMSTPVATTARDLVYNL